MKHFRKKRKITGCLLCCVIVLLAGCGAVQENTDSQSTEESVRSSGTDDTEDRESILEEQRRIPDDPYVMAYYEVLRECAQNGITPVSLSRGFTGKFPDTRFGLAFIDEDDIPELLIFPDNSHAAGVEVYTYINDQVVELGMFGSFGRIQYVEKEGMIFDHFMGQGEAHTYFYQMENGEAKQVSHLHSWPDYSRYLETGECPELYEVDEVSVTEDIYNAKWDELYDSQKYVLIGHEDGIPLEETGLLPTLAQAIEELPQVAASEYDTLVEKLLLESGMEEEAILLMDYDDYDGDGIYEAFAFCGKSHECLGETGYRGAFWFVSGEQCMKLPARHGDGYRKIDGQMVFSSQGHKQKYLYYYSDYNFTANISEIWTVENGKPVAVELPQSGQVVYSGDSQGFELWVDSYNHYYELDGELWTGHTWRPYFYHYDGESNQLKPDEREDISSEALAELCGFDLVAEVEAEGYEVTAIVRWQPSDIVTINYTIPLDEEDVLPEITYENIIWDCKAGDYWRSGEWGVTSWRNAGVGGSI